MPIHIIHIYIYTYIRGTRDDDSNNIKLGVMMFSPLNKFDASSSDVDLCPRCTDEFTNRSFEFH